MVDYNPSMPRILGQEWVPIRNEYTIFGENQTSGSEVGTTFSLNTARQVNNARFYLDDFVYGRFVNEGITFNIYPKGEENQSGPIQKVVIPCTSGATTGGITFSTPATDVPSALRNPGTIRQSGLIFNGVAGFTAFRAQFGVMQNTYAQALVGKRILGVTLVSQVIIDSSMTVDSDEPIESIIDINIEYGLRRIAQSALLFDWEFQPVMEMESGDNMTTPPRNTDVSRRDRLGNFSMYGATMLTTGDTHPWTYNELTKFDSTFGASSVAVQVSANNLGSNIPLVRFTYMALEVYFCEEKRVAFGTQVFNEGPVTLGTETRYQRGMNRVELYNLAGSTNPILPAGDYTVTISQTDFGDNFDITDKTNTTLRLNSLRELYVLPSFETKEVILPSIMDDTALGQVLTDNEIVVVPQLSLHLSGGAPLTEVHPYGRQGVAQVYGDIVAIQEISDAIDGPDAEYLWVKFYARRWGDTTVPLTIAGTDTLTNSTASITPDEFDALPEILDGWKEVNLQFDNAATLGSVGDPSFQWSAEDETSGNRWEILAAVAPALSGTQGNLFNGVPTTQQLYTATYHAPTGDTQELIWTPQGVASQWISGSGVINDDAADAVLLLGQEVEPPSGTGVVTLCQPVTGIGQECDVDPCCIPTSLYFNQISWDSQSSLDALGYSFELQRQDTVDTDWATIMLSPASQTAGMLANGDDGDFASTPDSAALDVITGDFDIRVDATLDAWVTGIPAIGNDYLFGKYNAAGNQRSYVLRLNDGGLQLLHSQDGTVVRTATATAELHPINGRLAVRATLDADSGGGNRTVTFYTAPTLHSQWTQLGDAVTDSGTSVIFNSTASLIVNGIDQGQAGLAPGTFHGAELRNGINGTIIANPDFTAQQAGTTSFTDSTGKVWTINGDAEIVNETVTTFNDFEARIGVETCYRIRVINDYDFYSDWVEIDCVTIDEPGVVIGCEGGHILTFTSNERQDGSINLAYSSVWYQQQVEESFTFPETSFVTLQPMYDRNYFVAFRPTERGGESFNRTVLVQAAAIDPETLADFRSLRDMAWEDVNYICVRDEDGNRWFASVGVPSGRVLNNRRLYLAPVQIVEVTDTPTPVELEPGSEHLVGEGCP